jgi:predicted solute-binding protein
LRVLCVERFGIDPVFEPMAPDPTAMLRQCDAALLIGDNALFLDHEARGLLKVDLGEEWTAMTGLPFVWAFWAGRPGIMSREALAALTTARDEGVTHSDEVAAAYCGPERAEVGKTYLRENIRYSLGDTEDASLRRYYELAARHEIGPAARAPAFYHG